MEIGGREPTDTPNDDLLAFLMPFQRGARANAELPANGGRNRDLPLGGETGMGNRHTNTLPRYCGGVKLSGPHSSVSLRSLSLAFFDSHSMSGRMLKPPPGIGFWMLMPRP